MFLHAYPLLGPRPSPKFRWLPSPPHITSIPVVVRNALPLPSVVSFVWVVVFLPSKQPFPAQDWFNPTLDGGVFLLENGAPAERIHSLPDDGLTLQMKSSDYLISASFRLDYRGMRTLHAVRNTGVG